MSKIVLDDRDFGYLFEVKSNVERYIKAGIDMGKMGSLNVDLGILLGELNRLEGKVKEQLK